MNIDLRTLDPAAQVAAIVCGTAMIAFLGYWFIKFLRNE